MGEGGAAADADVLHQDAVFHLGPLGHADAPEENAVLHPPLHSAPIGHQRVDAGPVGVQIGGGDIHLLGEHRALLGEQLPADGGIKEFHAPVVVPGQGADLGGVPIPDEAPDLQLAGHAVEHRIPEAVPVLTAALLHRPQQQVLGEDEDIQGAEALGLLDVIEGMGDIALVIQVEEGGGVEGP